MRSGRPRIHVLPETWELSRPDACAALRLLEPYGHPSIARDFEVSFGHRLPEHGVDAVVLQRRGMPGCTGEQMRQIVRDVQRRGVKLVYDIDDNLLDPHPDVSTEQVLAPSRSSVRFMLREADLVTVSTEMLRARMLRLNPATEIVPNALDERAIPSTPAPRPSRGLRIGYFGSFTHLRDLLSVLGPVRAALGRLPEPPTVVLCGISTDARLPSLFEGVAEVEVLPATGNYPDFFELMRARGDWHIGLAPLASGRFENAKSDIKYLEYAAFGVAGLYSAHPAYAAVRDAVTGLVAAPDGWADRLYRLATDPGLRAAITDAAHADLLAARTLAATGQRRADLLHRLLRKPQ